MPSALRNKKPNRPGTADDISQNLEKVAAEIEYAASAYNKQLRRDLAEWLVALRKHRRQRGVRIPKQVCERTSDDPHDRLPHRHDLLCVAPQGIVAQLRLMARILREEFAKYGAEASSQAHFPCVNIRSENVQPRVERTNVELSLMRLVKCARAEGQTPWAKPGADWRLVAFALHGANVIDAKKRSVGTSMQVAIGRDITELLDGLDTDTKRAIRRLAQVAFDSASVLDALAKRVAELNPGAMAFLDTEDVENSDEPDRVIALVAALLIGLNNLGGSLLQLDDAIRRLCLTAPYDQAPRRSRPEQTLFLRAIQHLDAGGFSEKRIALTIDDGGSDNIPDRIRRVREHLDRKENGLLRDRRTRFIPVRPPSSAPT